MTRVPGRPAAKAMLLASLNQDDLPYLVADILALNYSHREIRVVDGPGDGRRDIHSKTRAGERCLTQCKFHQDPKKGVSSRETDELPLALHKFGARTGFFATTARLSPQAAREYLDNFPGFELSFFSGMELVDEVLRSPSLRAVWLEGESISRVAPLILQPFVVRDISTATPIDCSALLSDELVKAVVPDDVFCPYQPPTNPAQDEDGGRQITAYAAQMRQVFEASSTRADLMQKLAVVLSDRAVAVRVGRPVVRARDEDTNPLTQLPFAPETFVASSGMWCPEKEWVLPAPEVWSFPEVSVADAPWACWMSEKHDLWVEVSLSTPKSVQPDFFLIRQVNEYRKNCFEASLFLSGALSECKEFLNTIGSGDQPTFQCPFGPGGKLAEGHFVWSEDGPVWPLSMARAAGA